MPLLEVSLREDRIIARFSCFFALFIGIDDRKSLPSRDQYVPVRITLHVLRCIPLREASHGEDGIIGFFFSIWQQ